MSNTASHGTTAAAGDQNGQATAALQQRIVIDQAKGILAEARVDDLLDLTNSLAEISAWARGQAVGQSSRPADEDRCGGRNTMTRFADGDLATPGHLDSFGVTEGILRARLLQDESESDEAT